MAITYRNRKREEEDRKSKEEKPSHQEVKDLRAMMDTLATKEDAKKNTERLTNLEEIIKRLVEQLAKTENT